MTDIHHRIGVELFFHGVLLSNLWPGVLADSDPKTRPIDFIFD